jgi:xanthine dehydrogenase YagS FAD-binding subunit
MQQFDMIRAQSAGEAVRLGAQGEDGATHPVRFLAGGTTLLDLMKLNVEQPQRVLDINRLPLDKIEQSADGGLKIGALVRNSDLAHHPLVMQRYPVLSQALLSGASAATHALRVLPRHRHGLQQASTRFRLLGHRRLQSQSGDPGHQR